MRKEYKEKKQFFLSFAVALSIALMVGLNSFTVFAEENQDTETIVEIFQQEQYDNNVGEVDERNEEDTVNEVETEADFDTILDEKIVDEDAIEDVTEVCTMIDSLPTVETFYENAPDEAEEDTIPEEETIDVAVTENVSVICTMIDSLPTVEALYENAPGEAEESYVSWLLEIDNVFKKARIIQEQYNALSLEEQNVVGEDRKIKLEELCNLAAMFSEKAEVYVLDSPFIDENGVCYQVIQDGNDRYVEVISSSNYTQILDDSLVIPKEVFHNDKMYIVTKIKERAFFNCDRLVNVTIPDSVTTIEQFAFYNCTNLQSVTISHNVSIGIQAFNNCFSFETLKIVVNSESEVSIVTLDNSDDSDVFENCANERSIIFIQEDDTELNDSTTPSLEAAVDAYKAVDDGNKEDELWHGWKLPVVDSVLQTTVAITVRKDDALWENNNRVFGLKQDDSDFLIQEPFIVEDGIYKLYDITEVPDGVDTTILVSVNGEGTQNIVVDYYTVTFYDGDIPYGDDTDQCPQIVLKNLKSMEPLSPEKEGYLFDKWVTTKDGDDPFVFDDTIITEKKNIYASWTQGYIITASAEGDGNIIPEGNVSVSSGENITFTFLPNEGRQIKTVIVDDIEITLDEQMYIFENVNANHTITVVFEEDENDENPDPGEGDDNPGEGDNPGSGETPGGGNTPGEGDDNPGEGDNPGSGETPGGGNTPGEGDDNPGEGDNPGSGETPGGGNTPGEGDNPGSGETPGGGNTPGEDDDNPGSGETPGGGNTPGSGETPGEGNTPGSGETPGDNTTENGKKPTHGGKNDNSENNSDNSLNSNNNQIHKDVVTDNNVPVIVSNNDIGNGIIASNTDSVHDNTEEYGYINSPKDKEPATGDSFDIKIYIIIAMTAGFMLLLLSFTDIKQYITDNCNIK